MTDPRARLRVVIVNHNGGELLLRAVDSVRRSDWDGPIDIVIVDNASADDSLAPFATDDDVRLIRRDDNEGFGANNHGIADLLGIDSDLELPETEFVALLNPDAMVQPGAFGALAAALAPTRRIGAAAPKIIFDRPFVQLDVSSGEVTVSEVRVGGRPVTSQCHTVGDAHRLPGGDGPLWRCSSGSALRVPTRRFGDLVDVRFEKNSHGVIGGTTVDGAGTVSINSSALQSVVVVQNAGSELDGRYFGRNRGFADLDGATAYSTRPPGWCGAAVMFHADYLRDVGGFEPAYFLYYEDVDLSLRGIARGWSTVYVPSAVVEHRHSDRATQGTRLVEVLQHRNRLIMLFRNAPLGVAVGALLRSTLTPASLAVSALGNLRTSGPHLRLARWRVRAVSGALRRLPWAIRSRRDIGRNRRIPAKRVIAEATGSS